MASYVNAELRRQVEERAGGKCEYCLIHDDDTYVGCQVDHIIAVKHGGLTEQDNLAFACAVCNRAKGTDIASLIPGTRKLIKLFNPRTDAWADHFRLDMVTLLIEPTTDIGRVTAALLGFNEIERVLERQSLVQIGRFPVGK